MPKKTQSLSEKQAFIYLRDAFIGILLLGILIVWVSRYLDAYAWGAIVLSVLFLYAAFKRSLEGAATFIVVFLLGMILALGEHEELLLISVLAFLGALIAYLVYFAMKGWLRLRKSIQFYDIVLAAFVLFLIPTLLTLVIDARNNKDFSSFNEINNAAVVKLICTGVIGDDSSILEGSGTLISDDGMILTNAHLFPDFGEAFILEYSDCLVFLPDPVRGELVNTFQASPVFIRERYDLAYLQIETELEDFPTIECINRNLDLGDRIRILGYPSYKGVLGYSLTLTEGIISSFPEEGIAMTSAKIEPGTSGGLVIDQNGCMIGTPTFFVPGEAESLGGIVLYQDPPE